MATAGKIIGKVVQEDIKELVPLLEEMLPDWDQFGLYLPVAFEDIETIKSEVLVNHPTKNMNQVLKWCKENKKNWSDIVKALNAIGNKDLASRVPQDGNLPNDKQWIILMLKDYHLEEITADWKQFGLQLGIPFHKLKTISPQPTAEDYMLELLSKWIEEQKEEATISALLEACKGAGNPALAEKLEEEDAVKNILGRTVAVINAVCRVYQNKEDLSLLTLVIVRKDKAESIRAYYEQTHNRLVHKEVTVEMDIKLDGSTDMWESKNKEIQKSLFDKGQKCAIHIKTKNAKGPFKLQLEGVSPPEIEITIPPNNENTEIVMCTSTTGTTYQ